MRKRGTAEGNKEIATHTLKIPATPSHDAKHPPLLNWHANVVGFFFHFYRRYLPPHTPLDPFVWKLVKQSARAANYVFK